MLTKEDINFIMGETGILDQENISLFCVTYNLGGMATPEQDEVRTLFGAMAESSRENLPDVIVVGLQEMVDLNTTNVVTNGNTLRAAEKWLVSILTVVNEIECEAASNMTDAYQTNPYELVAQESMVGLYICLLCTHSIRPFFKHVSTAQCPRGISAEVVGQGLLGNKGGVCIRFEIQDNSVCLVNAHMAAHREHVGKRNDDFHAILHDGIFTDPFFDVYRNSEAAATAAAAAVASGKGMANVDLVRLRSNVKGLKKRLEGLPIDVSVGGFDFSSVTAAPTAGSGAAQEGAVRVDIAAPSPSPTPTPVSIPIPAVLDAALPPAPSSSPGPAPSSSPGSAPSASPKGVARRGSLASIKQKAGLTSTSKLTVADPLPLPLPVPVPVPLPAAEEKTGVASATAAEKGKSDGKKGHVIAEDGDEEDSDEDEGGDGVGFNVTGAAVGATSSQRRESIRGPPKPPRPASLTRPMAPVGANHHHDTTHSHSHSSSSSSIQSSLAPGLEDYSAYVRELAEEERERVQNKAEADRKKRNTRLMALRSIGDEEHRMCVDDHDIIIWMGDLNYRLTTEIADEDALAYIRADMTLDLAQEYDQLTRERDGDRAFQDFHEGLLMFPPSYKYVPGTADYDVNGKGKNRCPAWCDRVLWRTRVTPASRAVSHLHTKTETEMDTAARAPGQSDGAAAASGVGEAPAMNGGAGTGAEVDAAGKYRQSQEGGVGVGAGAGGAGGSGSRVSASAAATAAAVVGTNAANPTWIDEELDVGMGFVPSNTLPGKSDAHMRYVQKLCAKQFSNYSSNGLENPDSTALQLMLYSDIHLYLSDHRPVCAMFNVRVRRVDWAARERLLLDVTKECADINPDFRQKLETGLPLCIAEPNHLMLYSDNREFNQVAVEFTNTHESAPLWLGVKEGSLPPWVRCNYTVPEVEAGSAAAAAAGGAPSAASAAAVASEWTSSSHAAPLCIPAQSSLWLWVTIDNVAAMMQFADGYAGTNVLLKPMEEEIMEVSTNLLMDVWAEVPVSSSSSAEGGTGESDGRAGSERGSTVAAIYAETYTYSYHLAEPADAEELSIFAKKAFRDTFFEPCGYTEDDLERYFQESSEPHHWVEHMQNAERHLLIARAYTHGDSRSSPAHIVGYLMVGGAVTLPDPQLSEQERLRCGEIFKCYVCPTTFGKGVAKALVDKGLPWLLARYPGDVYLGVWSENWRAQRFYQKFGFAFSCEYMFPVGDKEDREFIYRCERGRIEEYVNKAKEGLAAKAEAEKEKEAGRLGARNRACSALMVPVLLVLRATPSGYEKGTSVVESSSLHYRLQKMT